MLLHLRVPYTFIYGSSLYSVLHFVLSADAAAISTVICCCCSTCEAGLHFCLLVAWVYIPKLGISITYRLEPSQSIIVNVCAGTTCSALHLLQGSLPPEAVSPTPEGLGTARQATTLPISVNQLSPRIIRTRGYLCNFRFPTPHNMPP